jgi:hypothetical protein
MLKVKGNESLARDPESWAIVNTDSNALRKAQQAKRTIMARIESENRLESRIEMLEAKIEELLRIKNV